MHAFSSYWLTYIVSDVARKSLTVVERVCFVSGTFVFSMLAVGRGSFCVTSLVTLQLRKQKSLPIT